MAVDWTYGLEASTDLSYIEDALRLAESAESTVALDADAGACAIAAAATVARLNGADREASAYTDAVDDWVAKQTVKPSQALLTTAREALTRVSSPPSELLDLWNESGEAANWRAYVVALLDALR